MASQRKHLVVVGAGPGGLALAMLAAKAGLRVTVFERLPHVGGRTSTIEADGFRFDRGPTFFRYPQVLDAIFRAVGRSLREEIAMVRLDPQYRIVFGAGGQIDATPDTARMESEVAAISPSDARQLRRFMAESREKYDRLRPCLEKPFPGWGSVLTPRMLRLLPVLRPWASLDRELGRHFEDPRMRLGFSFPSTFLGMSPFRCPSAFSILSYLEHAYGVLHPMGGCGAVSRRMGEIAEEMGVEIALCEPVESIVFEGRRAAGVRTSGGVCRCDALAIDADFARAMTRLVPDRLRRRWSDRAIARKRFSCSTFMMYLGIEGRYDHLRHHTIYMPATYRDHLEDIDQRHVLSGDTSFYVQNACATDPAQAPPGASTLYVLVPVSHQHENIDWSRQREPFRRRVLEQLARVGLGDVASRIRCEKVVTPADWDREMEMHLGATFHLAHNVGQMLHLRPHNRFEDLAGVYLVGGGTHPGGSLPAIYASARITCRLLLDDLRVSDAFLDNVG